LDDVEIMINNDLDRQAGHEKNNNNVLINIIIGLLMFSLILILIIYITYRCNFQNTYKPYEPSLIKSKEQNTFDDYV